MTHPALMVLADGTRGTHGFRGTQGTHGIHGARDLDGPEVIAHLLVDVRRRLPGVEVSSDSVEVIAPGVPEVMSGWERPVVMVPLLLSSGYHVTTDLPVAARLSGAPVHLAGSLGPDRHLARVMTARLREAGALFGDAVVLAVAGSEDPAAQAGAEQAAELLRSEWGPRVTLAFVPGAPAMGPDLPATESDGSVAGPDLPSAVEHLRQAGATRVCVAPYALLPGRFSSRVTALASAAGATTVASVLGRHRLVADLVVLRFQEGLSALAASSHLVAGSLSDTPSDNLSDQPSDGGLYSVPSAQLLVSNQ